MFSFGTTRIIFRQDYIIWLRKTSSDCKQLLYTIIVIYYADFQYQCAVDLTIIYFSDSTPIVIFKATLDGIGLLEFDGYNTKNSSSIIQTPIGAVRIDQMYSKDEIVFQNSRSDPKMFKYEYISVCNNLIIVFKGCRTWCGDEFWVVEEEDKRPQDEPGYFITSLT